MFIIINLHHVQITYCNYDCFHIFCKDLWNVNTIQYNTIQYKPKCLLRDNGDVNTQGY